MPTPIPCPDAHDRRAMPRDGLPSFLPAGERQCAATEDDNLPRDEWIAVARALFNQRTGYPEHALLFSPGFDTTGASAARLLRLTRPLLPAHEGQHLISVRWQSYAMLEITTLLNDQGPACLLQQGFLVSTQGGARLATSRAYFLFADAREALGPATGPADKPRQFEPVAPSPLRKRPWMDLRYHARIRQ